MKMAHLNMCTETVNISDYSFRHPLSIDDR